MNGVYIWKEFTAGAPDEPVIEVLGKMDELCPGDFSVVYKAIVLLYSRDVPRQMLSHAIALERLRSELEIRVGSSQRAIGSNAAECNSGDV
jgi:hypothetical protein